MHLTVCICTLDRPQRLETALRRLEALRAGGEGRGADWTVLVVNSGASSATAAVAAKFHQLGVRHVAEPRPGLSWARNRAIAEVREGGLLFLDDDAVAEPGYLAAYVAGFARYPGAAFFGGPIRAQVEGVDPAILEAVRAAAPGTLSWLEPDLTEGLLPEDGSLLPWGANMALRLDALGDRRFDPNVGRHPDRPHGAGEETLLFLDLLEAGAEGVWLPDARVDHHVGADRCSLDNIRAHSRGVGWFLGYRAARRGLGSERQVGARVAGTVRRLRARYLWTRLRRAPLSVRVAALHDLEVQNGWWEGYRDAFTLLEGTP